MKKKFKNKDLEEILAGAAHLGAYAMPGELTLAIIGTRKELKNAFETFTEACKQVGDSRCEKDANGNNLSVFQKDELGNDLIHHPKKLKFKNPQIEKEAIAELKNLGEKEIEAEVKQISKSVLEELKNITPIQMEAITVLTEIL